MKATRFSMKLTLGLSLATALILTAFPVAVLAEIGDVNLQNSESKGGHTLERHVGKTDAELVQRMEKEKRITGSSSFANVGDAEKAINGAIKKNQQKVEDWLADAKKGERLALSGSAKGRGIARADFNKAEKQADPAAAKLAAVKPRNSCKMILQADGKGGFIVLTAYPE